MSEKEPDPKASVPPGSDPPDRDFPTSAADDPTAMWDEGELRAAGMDDVAERVKSLPPPAATGPDVAGDSRQSVVVGDDERGPSPQARQATPRPRRSAASTEGLSWPITIGLAIALGLAVYFLVKLLR